MEHAEAVPAITRALERKARRGDVSAAREYREWIALAEQATQGGDALAVCTREERNLIRRTLNAALDRARRAAG